VLALDRGRVYRVSARDEELVELARHIVVDVDGPRADPRVGLEHAPEGLPEELPSVLLGTWKGDNLARHPVMLSGLTPVYITAVGCYVAWANSKRWWAAVDSNHLRPRYQRELLPPDRRCRALALGRPRQVRHDQHLGIAMCPMSAKSLCLRTL
jgi:hypothetical protein